MKAIVKHIKTNNNIKTFNINKKNNVQIFNKLLKVIEKINKDGFKSNLSQSKKYPENLYFSSIDRSKKTIEGRKYELELETLAPNAKGYVNIHIVDCKEIITEIKYTNYLDDVDDEDE